MSMLRFHWDFFGPDALPTAEHFRRHLNEFCASEGIDDARTSTAMVQGRCVATLECGEAHMILVRDRLRPKRAERTG